MDTFHPHCASCVSRRCMVKLEPGTSCELCACPLVCGAVFHSCKVDEHRLLCPLERVPCLNHSIGCPFVLSRYKIAEHLEVCPAGVVCCTMEWNRLPVNKKDYEAYELLSLAADREQQLDMALAFQDQSTMLSSHTFVSLAPTKCPERKLTELMEIREKPGAIPDVMAPTVPLEEGMGDGSVLCCSNNGINGLNQEHSNELYQTTLETTKSLSAALNVLIHLNASDTQRPTTSVLAAHSELNGELHEANGSSCDKISRGVSGLGEELQPKRHQTFMELGRNLVSALGALGEAVKSSERSCIVTSPNGEIHQSDTVECSDVEMKDSTSDGKVEFGAVVGVDDWDADTPHGSISEDMCQESRVGLRGKHEDEQCSCSICNRSNAVAATKSEDHPMEPAEEIDECLEYGGSWESVGPFISHRPEKRHEESTVVMQEASGSQAPLLQAPVHAHALVVPSDGVLPSMALDFEDKAFERNLQFLHNFMPLALNGCKSCFSESFLHRQHRGKMEDVAVDTSDLEQEEEPQNDMLDLGEIDLTAETLLVCLEVSSRARRISDTVYTLGGSRVDFGTQTFSFSAAVWILSTFVDKEASACDRAALCPWPSLLWPLRLCLTLEQRTLRSSWSPDDSLFTFVCGQLFRRDEFLSHLHNVHGDIHSGLNGWMEHRCPLACYGCSFSQRRFCPSRHGSKIVHDRHLRSFGVRPATDIVTEPACDRLSGLPFEILRHVARFLDGFSLCQLSLVSRTMRHVCASLLQTRGMVVLQWENRRYADGRRSWQIKDKVWRFSTAFSPVTRWEFLETSSMADHLKSCPYNNVYRQEEAVPLPCMCAARELGQGGRLIRSVLKPVL